MQQVAQNIIEVYLNFTGPTSDVAQAQAMITSPQVLSPSFTQLYGVASSSSSGGGLSTMQSDTADQTKKIAIIAGCVVGSVALVASTVAVYVGKRRQAAKVLPINH